MDENVFRQMLDDCIIDEQSHYPLYQGVVNNLCTTYRWNNHITMSDLIKYCEPAQLSVNHLVYAHPFYIQLKKLSVVKNDNLIA